MSLVSSVSRVTSCRATVEKVDGDTCTVSSRVSVAAAAGSSMDGVA